MSLSSSNKAGLYDSTDSRVGVSLRASRIQQGYSVEQVAEQLCIRSVHLKAIEEGDYDELPALVYARGFVRSYAEFLRLDHDSVLEQFRKETAGREQILDPVYVPSNSNRQLPSRRVIFGSLAGLAFLILVWSFWSSPSAIDDPSENAEAIGTVDMPAEDGIGLTTPPDMQKNIYPPVDTKRASDPAKDAMPVITQPVNQTPATATITAPVTAPVVPAETKTDIPNPPQTATAPEPSPQPVAAQPPNPLASATGIALEALSDSWIEITNYDDKPLYTRVLRKGEIYNIPVNLRGQYLTTGNAGGLMLRLNGERSGVLGNQGEVVHDIILDNRNLSKRARDLPR